MLMVAASLLVWLSLFSQVAAECPNACSGHGSCGLKDVCKCYQNYQGNDCSERTCYFGIAHVDTPKGDLNSDGTVSGPLTTVITGSEVYPWGTTEQYPNADANEGHFYMECSNKGICDRKLGICECFDGYEGTTCARASCPNDCSGHGTCETIKELAEMKTYDSNSRDVPTTIPIGASESTEQCTDPDGGSLCSAVVLNGFETTCTSQTDASGTECVYSKLIGHHSFDLAIEESYSYDLWDQDKTMGCKCDPQYYGADCFLMKCKYGVDPLFYDDVDGRIFQTTVVHMGNKDRQGDIGGTFRIVFFDVFGEKYVTKSIDASPTTTSASKIQHALEALPNGVISLTHSDITFEAGAGDVKANSKSPAVEVSMQKEKGSISKSGTIGAGVIGGSSGVTNSDGGAGMGTWGGGSGTDDPIGYGPEFTITFSTNPGILKTIELDTRQVTNPGVTDYWVANVRQGQFSSRYAMNVGRINTLLYGSKLLYTNDDWSTTVPVDTLVKVGGQETRIHAASAYVLTLADSFLGNSIIPILTDTTITATSLTIPAGETTVQKMTLTTGGVGKVTGNTLFELAAGAKLYLNGCPFTSEGSRFDGSGIADDSADVKVTEGNDCPTDDFSPTALILYRRSDDVDNQNLYKTSGDIGKETSESWCITRGGTDMYSCVLSADKVVSEAANVFTTTENIVADDFFNPLDLKYHAGVGEMVFVNSIGPLAVNAISGPDFTVAANGLFEDGGDSANTKWVVHEVVANTEVAAGKILMIDGRRYKVAETAAAGGVADSKVSFTEVYAGGQILEVCSNCVTEVAANTITTSIKMNLKQGDKLMVSGQTHQQLMFSVRTDVEELTEIKYSSGGFIGRPTDLTPQNGGSAGTALTGTNRLNLYRALNTHEFKATIVTESNTAVTYQYVSQCSNRGLCESTMGICVCFTGYTNDNCDTQNMLAY